MPGDPFLDDRMLTPEAFDFVLSNELKRAMRSQNFLTLLVVQPTPQVADVDVARAPAVRQIAGIIGREVRETDLLCQTREGELSVVLLDADLPSSLGVVDRLMARLDHYEFPTPLRIEVGAACCPTHGADADTLRRAAEAGSIPRRKNRGDASNAK
jgi:hypothetical protein